MPGRPVVVSAPATEQQSVGNRDTPPPLVAQNLDSIGLEKILFRKILSA